MDNIEETGGFADDGATVEPVTGNRVPPGSLDQEVRDNVDAKLSEGEYVIPADVVRYIGLGQIERMISKAKAGLEEMEANGRIGGEPVTEEGVPMGDDELTPEEMQMLAEAMGSDPAAGMYMGGMVQNNMPQYNPYAQQQMQYTNPNQPTVGMQEGGMVKNTAPQFNPADYQFGSGSIPGVSQDQGGMELVEYINPKTGQTRMITFLNGQPIGMVPEGFVRSTKETRKQASQQDQETTTEEEPDWMKDSDSQQRREEQSQEDKDSWAEENYEAISKDPLGYAKEQLSRSKMDEGISKFGPRAGMALAGVPGLLAGGAISAMNDLTPLASSRAAVELAKARGLDTTEIESEIKEYESNLKGPAKLLENFGAAQGTRWGSDLLEYESKLDEVKPTVSESSDKPKTTLNVPGRGKEYSSESEERRAQERYEEFSQKYEEDVKDAEENKYGQTTGKGLTVEDIEDSLTPPGMAKGGLVAKPSGYKSKVTKKKEKRKRSGLGSK